MAYLRKEQEMVEIDHPLTNVWEAIQKAIPDIEWTIEEIKDKEYQIKVKTKSGFMSYSSLLLIEAIKVTEDTTRINIFAETPVTTVTAVADFGRTRQRIDLFLAGLVKQLSLNKIKK
jgi:carbon monoxide dehydrogenase subunit G